MPGPNDVTLVEGAFHNPNEPRHFMQIVPAGRRVTASLGDDVIAASESAVVVKEVGRGVYDAVVYFPRDDVDAAALTRIDKTTHCPLKGDTEYFDISAGGRDVAEAAWSYVEIIGDHDLGGMIAFDTTQIDVD